MSIHSGSPVPCVLMSLESSAGKLRMRLQITNVLILHNSCVEKYLQTFVEIILLTNVIKNQIA